MKTALITGISGQGGSYLADALLNEGYRVIGTARSASESSYSNLSRLGHRQKVDIRSLNLTDGQAVLDLIDTLRPNEVYHLAAPSSVARSFIEPANTISDITSTTVNVLEAIRKSDRNIRCFVASSTEVYGNCLEPANAFTRHNPRSPYGIGKSCAHHQAVVYREAYGLYVCTGVLSNFESQLRPRNYVTAKIINSACDIALGHSYEIELGNTGIVRDWGAAQDLMNAARLSLKQPTARDYLIATGVSHSLNDFLKMSFSRVGLNYQDHLISKETLVRPLDIKQTLCDISETETTLGWKPKKSLGDVITSMLYFELARNVGTTKASEMLELEYTSSKSNVLNIDFQNK